MFIEQISGQKIKIKFDVNEKQLLLGDILKITASGKNGVLVQVSGISTAEKNPNFNIAESKILFTIDGSGKLISWQGNIPSQDFIITKLSAKEILLCSNTLNPQNPVPMGVLSLYPQTEINLEASFFEKPTVVYCDKQTQKDNILSLLSCELSKSIETTVLIDFNNSFSDLKISSILEAGNHLKLPFDLKGLELLYNKSLSEASCETRAVIEDIFIEIENYLSSGEAEFIPFSGFRKAVDSVYETNKLTELVLLKNKLLKLQKQGVFANKKQEITSFTEKIRSSNLIIIDLSKFPTDWQKDLIEFIIDSNTKKHKQKFFLVFDSDKINIDKVFIENLCGKANKNGVYPIIISGHESESAVSLLSYTSNIIAFAPENTTKITALQDNLIRLKDNEAIITGKITNNIPLYLNIYDTEAFEANLSSYNSNISIQASPEIYLYPEEEEETEETENMDEDDFNYSNQFSHDETSIELIENISKLQEEVYISRQEDLPKNTPHKSLSDAEPEDNEEYTISKEADEKEYDFDLEEDEVQNTNSASSFYDEDSLDYAVPEKSSFYDEDNDYDSSEKYASGFSKNDLSNFIDDDFENTPNSSQPYEEQGDENFNYNSAEEFQDESMLDYSGFYDASDDENNNEEAYSDEYNADIDEKPAKSSIQKNLSKPSMPDIPIYSTPKNQSDTSSEDDFQEGDKVMHSKYGIGTITKIIGSNEKRLCSIQFEDVGRRLLDPKLAELEKV